MNSVNAQPLIPKLRRVHTFRSASDYKNIQRVRESGFNIKGPDLWPCGKPKISKL